MQWRIIRYGHLPCVRLDEAEEIQLGEGSIRAVPWEEWYEVAGTLLVDSERRYREARPVFYVDDIGIDDADGISLELDLFEPFRVRLARVSFALLGALQALLPDPLHSNRYFLASDADQMFTDTGDRDREWTLSALPSWQVTPAQYARIAATAAGFEAIHLGKETPEVMRILEAIRLSTEPGLTELDAAVHMTIALEDVVNPDADKPLGEVFATRAAALTAPGFDRFETARDSFRALYRARSKLLHGEDAWEPLEKFRSGRDTVLEAAGEAGWSAVRRLAAHIWTGGSVEDVPAACESAASASGFAEFTERLDFTGLLGE